MELEKRRNSGSGQFSAAAQEAIIKQEEEKIEDIEEVMNPQDLIEEI